MLFIQKTLQTSQLNYSKKGNDMDLEEFEQVVKNGQTIDFESCFAQTEDEDEIYAMRKICIENDANRKAYRDWADEFVRFEKDEDLQFLLVDNYHCLDIRFVPKAKKFVEQSSNMTLNMR